MCGRFTVAEPDPNAFSFRFGFSYSDFENFDWKPNYNVAPSHGVPVVTEDGERHAELMRVRLKPTNSGYSFGMMVMEGGEPLEIEGTVGSDGEVNVLKKVRAILSR